jgi:ABC-type enterobactin transport system, permease component
MKRRFKAIFLVLLILLLVSLIMYLGWGTYKISPLDSIKTLLGKGTKFQSAAILSLRLPRMLVGISVGIALSTAGALLQTVTKNELADSSIIGINAGAAVAAVIFVSLKTANYYSTLGTLSIYVLPFMAI